MTKDDRWLTTAEAAAYTKSSPAWITRRVEEGALRPIPLVNRRKADGPGKRGWVFDIKDLDALMERLKTNYAAMTTAEEAPRPSMPVAIGHESARERRERMRRM
jgi:hypothetical protein